jgi:hypothetical protein
MSVESFSGGFFASGREIVSTLTGDVHLMDWLKPMGAPMLRPCLVIFLVIGCSDGDSDEGPIGGSLRVSGSVVDFQTRTAVGTSATIAVAGITPPPKVSTEGATFTLDDVPENSLLQILASAPPTHVSTYSPVIEVTTSDRSGVDVPAIKSMYLESLATAFGVTPAATRAVVFMRLIDINGMPKAGVSASALVLSGGADQKGPFFLDANLMPAVGAQASTASGWAVFFDIAPGTISVAQAASATIDMPSSPVAAATVTLAEATVRETTPTLPTNVSFRMNVMPIWARRGCVACHVGGGAGNGLGNLRLDGTEPNPIYDELVKEKLDRVQLANPEASLILTKPLYESPPNHQNGTFATKQDPDYLTILAWIKEGAKSN